eukprot:COSAG03_NODE_15556_length_427_cov_1.560976_1_plen_59_part_00
MLSCALIRYDATPLQVTLEDYAGSVDTSVRNYAAVAQCETEVRLTRACSLATHLLIQF